MPEITKNRGTDDNTDPVVECHRVTGEDCFIATAHLRSIEEPEAVIDEIPRDDEYIDLQSTPVPRRTCPLA